MAPTVPSKKEPIVTVSSGKNAKGPVPPGKNAKEAGKFSGFIGGRCYYNTFHLVFLFVSISFRPALSYQDCSDAVGNSSSSNSCVDVDTSIDEECDLCDIAGSSQYYQFCRVLNASDGIEKPGEINWWIMIGLFGLWLSVWEIIIKSVKVPEMVVYFAAIFPFFVLWVFLTMDQY